MTSSPDITNQVILKCQDRSHFILAPFEGCAIRITLLDHF
jgi:hypothetical protein